MLRFPQTLSFHLVPCTPIPRVQSVFFLWARFVKVKSLVTMFHVVCLQAREGKESPVVSLTNGKWGTVFSPCSFKLTFLFSVLCKLACPSSSTVKNYLQSPWLLPSSLTVIMPAFQDSRAWALTTRFCCHLWPVCAFCDVSSALGK